ncbi:unnamed protein product [Rhodiola kirilowii]
MSRFGYGILCLLLLSARACSRRHGPAQAEVPGFFIFGDSLVDNGNNNYMLTLARANYRPYGIDFPRGTTGRFTNGLTYVDALAQLLGFRNFIPPYARTRGRRLLSGVNYASGASGIRDETGNNLGQHHSMNLQVSNFRDSISDLRRYFRGDNTSLNLYLRKCIIYCGMGSNDYLNNYFMTDFYSTSTRFTPKAYAASLLQDYARQLTELYELGARKFIVTAVGQIVHIPNDCSIYETSEDEDIRLQCLLRLRDKIPSGRVWCVAEVGSSGAGVGALDEDGSEKLARGWTRMDLELELVRCRGWTRMSEMRCRDRWLRRLAQRFNRGTLPKAKFVFLDSYESTKDLITNAASYGFEVVDKGCCGVGRNNGQITCLPLQMPCRDRKKYLFWDAFHPTEAANTILAKSSFSSRRKSFAYPINIQKLAAL